MKVELEWVTPNGDDLIAKMARVSSPSNENNTATAPRLLRYLIRKKHWSPFEMVNACVYIECPRDISRQILRHRSFSFQEFSGRYAKYNTILEQREARLNDPENRQNSLPAERADVEWFQSCVDEVRSVTGRIYESAISRGIAKEVARALLPEGLTPTRMYMNGTLRSWMHYWDVRCGPETQKEHRDVANETKRVILEQYPTIRGILNET